MKMPCEIIVWYLLPGIRRELAMCLIDDHDLTQANVAKKLDITEAAVSQYRSAKRGNLAIPDEVIVNEIKRSAKLIAVGNRSTTAKELCRICVLAKESDILPELYKKHTGTTMPDCLSD